MKTNTLHNPFLKFESYQTFLVVPLIVLCLFFQTGCKKTYIKKHYTGNFYFTVYRTESHCYNNNSYYTYETLSSQGTIIYNEKTKILKIVYLPDISIDCSIDRDGKLYKDSSSGLPTISGNFINENEIEFNSQWGFDQYVCWAAYDRVTGERQ